jgi:hypothetical protein
MTHWQGLSELNGALTLSNAMVQREAISVYATAGGTAATAGAAVPTVDCEVPDHSWCSCSLYTLALKRRALLNRL